jgi:hypothetical protein
MPHIDATTLSDYTKDLLSGKVEVEISKRSQDNKAFYRISNNYNLGTYGGELYKGDCFTNTSTCRMQTNFIDNDCPTNDEYIYY